jgi:tetraacyldisaccharide 4'-kinase
LIVFRILLYPLALLYGLGTWIRNMLFDRKILPEQEFDVPVINVGNLRVGGTGKTPHVEYLLRLLQPHYKTATLSRGYGRKSLGYILADDKSTADEIGDEPLMYSTKFKDTLVVVCEKRLYAIPNLIGDHPETDVIVMDDAYQHRGVKPGLNILLTSFDNPFYDDLLLPSGMLREARSGYRRADIIIVTGCPEQLRETEKAAIIKRIDPTPSQKVFFSTVVYGQPVHAFNGAALPETGNFKALVFSGIANARPFEHYCEKVFKETFPLEYKDHHTFDHTDIHDIIHRFSKIEGEKIILCTEKDRMRLLRTDLEVPLRELPFYYLPIAVKLLGGEQEFTTMLEDLMQRYKITE